MAVFALFHQIRQLGLEPITSKWLKLDQHCLQQKCSSKNLPSGNIWSTAIHSFIHLFIHSFTWNSLR